MPSRDDPNKDRLFKIRPVGEAGVSSAEGKVVSEPFEKKGKRQASCFSLRINNIHCRPSWISFRFDGGFGKC